MSKTFYDMTIFSTSRVAANCSAALKFSRLYVSEVFLRRGGQRWTRFLLIVHSTPSTANGDDCSIGIMFDDFKQVRGEPLSALNGFTLFLVFPLLFVVLTK